MDDGSTHPISTGIPLSSCRTQRAGTQDAVGHRTEDISQECAFEDATAYPSSYIVQSERVEGGAGEVEDTVIYSSWGGRGEARARARASDRETRIPTGDGI